MVLAMRYIEPAAQAAGRLPGQGEGVGREARGAPSAPLCGRKKPVKWKPQQDMKKAILEGLSEIAENKVLSSSCICSSAPYKTVREIA